MSNKTKYYPYEEIDIEKIIQDKIREEVLEKESKLKEKNKNQQIQDINLSVLEEMTDVLTKEEIIEIANKVRSEYEDKKTSESKLKKWYNKNSQVLNALIVTITLFFLFIIQVGIPKEHMFIAAAFGFPFLVILFGICYFFGGLFKNG